MSEVVTAVNTNSVIYPSRIKVSGLPFMLQGWNNVFYWTTERRDNKPVYRLEPYVLYWTIPIIGVTIYSRNGKWVFQRDYDDEPLPDIYKYGAQSDPLGSWTMGMKVEPYDEY